MDDVSILIFSGLAHLGTNDGIIYKLSQENNKINVKKLLILPGSPCKIRKVNDNEIMIAVYPSGTFILTKELKLKEAICK